MEEIWKDIPGHEGNYQASNFGRIKSLNYQGKHRELIMKPKNLGNGRFAVKIFKNKLYKYEKIHRLVLMAFCGKCPEGMECMHLDDNPSNNKIENLKWGTRSENQKQKFKNGRSTRKYKTGEDNPSSKLKLSDVIRIRNIYKNATVNNGYWKQLANSLNVKTHIIYDVIRNKTWKSFLEVSK